VPRFEPFHALRYASADLNLVAAPPYDVLSEADREALAQRHPNNIVHIDVPVESDGPGRYDAAGDVLDNWVTQGVLVEDAEPSFTIYRMTFRDEAGTERTTFGVIGALEVVDEGAGGVLPHERTTPKAKTDRLDLTRATMTNLSPVWGLSLTAGLTELLRAPGELLGTVTTEGVTHTIERVSDPARVVAISQAVSSISRTFRDEQRKADTGSNGSAELTMTYVGELIEEQLSVEAIHRLYTGIDFAALQATFEKFFSFVPAGKVVASITYDMQDKGALVLIDDQGNGTFMIPRPEMFAGIRDLDGARLEHALSNVSHDVSYQHGVGLVADIVASGKAAAGVLIRPVTVAEIQRTADEGLLMPPKSTFFTPKLRTGPVVRPLH
jgi:uncharacterized protein (DUF1015 family)